MWRWPDISGEGMRRAHFGERRFQPTLLIFHVQQTLPGSGLHIFEAFRTMSIASAPSSNIYFEYMISLAAG